MQTPSVATDVGRSMPLAAGAVYLNFISQYGSVIVTSLAIVYGVMQIALRWQEYLLSRKKEKAHRRH